MNFSYVLSAIIALLVAVVSGNWNFMLISGGFLIMREIDECVHYYLG